MKFNFTSMYEKYEQITGKPFDHRSNVIKDIREKCVKISLEGKNLDMPIIRDWCQEKFGNNWIYAWDQFFFLRPEDATLFSLRWS